jgi:hypothetical protein
MSARRNPISVIYPNQSPDEVIGVETPARKKGLRQGRCLEGVVGVLPRQDVMNPATLHLRYGHSGRRKGFKGRAHGIPDCKPDKGSDPVRLEHIKRSSTKYIYPRTVVFFEER